MLTGRRLDGGVEATKMKWAARLPRCLLRLPKNVRFGKRVMCGGERARGVPGTSYTVRRRYLPVAQLLPIPVLLPYVVCCC